MSEGLCLECKEEFKKMGFIPMPHQHCHHDPFSMKPKCWCEINETEKSQTTKTIDGKRYYVPQILRKSTEILEKTRSPIDG